MQRAFIKLTLPKGSPTYINIDHIIEVRLEGGETIIYLTYIGGNEVNRTAVEETIEEVMKMIENVPVNPSVYYSAERMNRFALIFRGQDVETS